MEKIALYRCKNIPTHIWGWHIPLSLNIVHFLTHTTTCPFDNRGFIEEMGVIEITRKAYIRLENDVKRRSYFRHGCLNLKLLPIRNDGNSFQLEMREK